MDPALAVRRAVRNRTVPLGVALAVLLAAAVPAPAAELHDPLSPLTTDKGSILCFRRDYSREHLARHPKQTTKSVLLAFQQGFVNIVLTPRKGVPKRIAGGCGWGKGAGIDTSDHKMIPNFNKPAGFDCMVTVGDTAEEGGYFLLDPAQDAKSLTLFLQDSITTVRDGPAKAYDLTLGKEDRTFALTRIGSKACDSFKIIVK